MTVRASAVATIVLVALATPAVLRAQTPTTPTNQPTGLTSLVLADSVVLNTFSLAGGREWITAGPFTLDHTLLGGLIPSHYRVSKYADFRDATWQPYPRSVPVWSNATFTGACGSGSATGSKMVAYFQVRAQRSTLRYVLSEAKRDTVCHAS